MKVELLTAETRLFPFRLVHPGENFIKKLKEAFLRFLLKEEGEVVDAE